MLKVYVIINDCPRDFGDIEMLRIYINRKDARKYVKTQKGAAPYENQYLKIVPMNVKTNE